MWKCAQQNSTAIEERRLTDEHLVGCIRIASTEFNLTVKAH
jgi:hypothetical protein